MFINWGNQTTDSEKAAMEWRRRMLEEEAMHEAMVNSYKQSSNQQTAAAAIMGGSSQPSSLSFVVNTTEWLIFRFEFISTNEPIEFTINWGDGTIHEDSGYGGFYEEEHEYAEAGSYTVTVTFDNPLKVLELDFPGFTDDYAGISSITGLQTLANLQDFRADYNHLVSIDFSGLTNLTYVDVSDCNIPGTSTNSLVSINLSGCTALQELRLDDSNFLAGLSNLAGLNNLEWIDLDQCNITGSVNLSSLANLRGFDLYGNGGLTEVIISNSQPLGDGREIYLYDCALTQTAVDNILVALSTNGVSEGYVDMEGGTNAAPSSTGLAAKAILESNGWNVYVNTPPPGYVSIAASTDFDIVGDFTIEMFVNVANVDNFPRTYSFGAYPAANAISIEGGGSLLYFWANNTPFMSGTTAFTPGSWNHIAVMGSGSTAYLYIDGAQVASAPYGGSISSQGLPLTIGYGNEPGSGFNGLMSNFRWSNAALYPTASFTPPTSPLTSSADTVLLTFQGTDLTAQLLDNSGNNHNATNSGAAYSALNPFTGVSGSLQVGTI